MIDDEVVGSDNAQSDSAGSSRVLSAIDRQYAAQTDEERRIFILGSTGSIGKLVAHSLRGLPNPPPVTLSLHRPKLLHAWEKSKKEITIEDLGHEIKRSGFDVELREESTVQHGVEIGQRSAYEERYEAEGLKPHEAAKEIEQQNQQEGETGPLPSSQNLIYKSNAEFVSTEPIQNLIVATKAAFTISALRTVRHRLSPESTICFLQNGMGIIDDVNKEIFPDPATRPNYIQGIITHGVNVPPEKAAKDPFFAVHAGHGTIALGLIPRDGIGASVSYSKKKELDEGDDELAQWAPSSRYLLRTLTSSPVLCAVGFTPTELLQQQLEKLAVNSVLNTLTSLIDSRNGNILYNFSFTRTMRLMLAETSHVICSLPELRNVPNVNVRFSPERLEKIVVSVADKTKDNISSMLADVRGGRKTEVDYINGYLIRRGEEIGIKCVVNYAIMHMVIGKATMIDREMQEDVPVDTKPLDAT